MKLTIVPKIKPYQEDIEYFQKMLHKAAPGEYNAIINKIYASAYEDGYQAGCKNTNVVRLIIQER